MSRFHDSRTVLYVHVFVNDSLRETGLLDYCWSKWKLSTNTTGIGETSFLD